MATTLRKLGTSGFVGLQLRVKVLPGVRSRMSKLLKKLSFSFGVLGTRPCLPESCYSIVEWRGKVPVLLPVPYPLHQGLPNPKGTLESVRHQFVSSGRRP